VFGTKAIFHIILIVFRRSVGVGGGLGLEVGMKRAVFGFLVLWLYDFLRFFDHLELVSDGRIHIVVRGSESKPAEDIVNLGASEYLTSSVCKIEILLRSY
jgi:hypothetical protein